MEPGHLLWALLFMCPLWPQLTNGATRVYYLGIQDVQWNYAPKGRNVIKNQPLDNDTVASSFLKSDKNRIGSSYQKTIYKEYRDSSYMDEVAQPAWLGFLGPVLQAEVGDVILIHLKNFATRPYTIHPHGVFYEKDSEGSLYPDGSSGWLKADDSVPPGGSHIYNWTIPESHAPTDADPACLTWIYHSHVDAPRDIATGLIGPLLTCKRGALDGNSSPRRLDVDHNFFLLFSVVDENLSWHLNENIATYCSDPASVDREDEAFQESNRMHAINGFVFGNLPELSMCAQKRVAWHLFGMGNEVDVHTAFFHGQILTIRGHRTDVAHIFPATFVTAEMVPQESGTWLISCQVNSHLQNGMQALYKVKSCSMSPPVAQLTGKVRQYFIEAHEIQWDYGPTGHDGSTGKSLMEPGSGSDKFFQKSSSRIGGTYWKVRYEAFQDETFQKKVKLEEEKHLGILGPVIRAEVGDIIQVVFYNRASQPFSIQPHGVFYEKDYEGTIYNDGTFEIYCQAGNHREAGMSAIYNVSQCPGRQSTPRHRYQAARIYYIMAEEVEWDYCPDRSWEFEWHNQSEKESYGHIFLSNKDGLLGSRYKKAVFREYTDGTFRIPRPRTELEEHLGILGPLIRGEVGDILTVVFKNNANRPYSVHAHGVLESSNNQPLAAEPAINGKLYSNLRGLTMYQGERVAWYMLAMGQDIDLHTVHFHAESFLYRNGESYRADVVDLFPGTFEVVEMVVSNPGTWLMHCHVTDHVHAGMETLFTVFPQQEPLSTISTITKEIGKAGLPRDIEEGNVRMLGMQIPMKDVKMLASVLIAVGIILLLIVLALCGVVWYQHRQRKLRRNRRSILDDSFKLLSLKQ
ncbi:hephaestin isoform X6 [Elephas maximus indicus]|uniref:hephaestin isoform X6 n=1 Tax=Elephas maximus indicus TaxID=99487 RepID=UPI002116D0B6|nr:hephaestin isoform X6 [Elephas maximus indicus]